MKREIYLPSEGCVYQWWGYAGEKEHSLLIVTLPSDIADCTYCQAEITIKGKLYRTDNLEIDNGKVSFELTAAMVKESGSISAQIIGYVVDENGNIAEIGKTEIFKSRIKPSSGGIINTTPEEADFWQRCWVTLQELSKKYPAIISMFSNSKHIPSVTAFPETAKNGDAVLLHRCNEITADDANGAVILDTAAIAALSLPEGYAQRMWEFEAKNASGTGFSLVLEHGQITTTEETYILTSIYLVSETCAGRWYWRDGQPYYDISNASAEPVPELIPLGNVDSFTASKIIYNEDYEEFNDADETVIFRTIPRHYLYSSGVWQLTERTDAAEGAIIGNVTEVEKDGQLFLRLRLVDNRNLMLNKNLPQYIDIPVSAVNSSTTTEGGVTLNGAELDLGVNSSSGSISVNDEGYIVIE